MATSILGTFPILNFRKSQTDEYGFDYVSFQYTIKTSDLAQYNIKKDDVFTEIESWGGVFFAKSPSYGGAPYVVDTVENNNIAGGLTELTVNTVGSKNSPEANPPRVDLLSGGPLIFGLSGTPPPPTSGNSLFSIPSTFGYGIAGAGQSVEIKFLANGGAAGQQETLTTYLASQMPTTFRGIFLPAPVRKPGRVTSSVDGGGATITGFCQYDGFVCKTILTERRGSLLLVTLTFSEAGFATRQVRTTTSFTNSDYYRFPILG